MTLRSIVGLAVALALAPAVHAGGQSESGPSRDGNCLYSGMGEGTIARLDAGECMRSMTEARAKELEGIGQQ